MGVSRKLRKNRVKCVTFSLQPLEEQVHPGPGSRRSCLAAWVAWWACPGQFFGGRASPNVFSRPSEHTSAGGSREVGARGLLCPRCVTPPPIQPPGLDRTPQASQELCFHRGGPTTA